MKVAVQIGFIIAHPICTSHDQQYYIIF